MNLFVNHALTIIKNKNFALVLEKAINVHFLFTLYVVYEIKSLRSYLFLLFLI